jgi:hypothetical protein
MVRRVEFVHYRHSAVSHKGTDTLAAMKGGRLCRLRQEWPGDEPHGEDRVLRRDIPFAE